MMKMAAQRSSVLAQNTALILAVICSLQIILAIFWYFA
jgi:hypothetical protein